MRRRVLQATIAAVTVAVVLLGFPLAFLGAQLVRENAVQALQSRAESLANSVDFRVEQDIALTDRLLETATGDAGEIPASVIVSAPDGEQYQAGERVEGRSLSVRVVSDTGATVLLYVSWWDVFWLSARVIALVVVAAVVAFAAGIAMAIWQANRLTAPLVYLAASAEQLGAGQVRPRLEPSGVEEIDLVAAELARSADRMAARLAAERQFASDASHQLRTPLTALSMRLEEIMLATDDPNVSEEARISLEQVERLVRVVDDLLASSRRLQGGTTEAVRLLEVVHQQEEEWQPTFQASGRRLVVEVDPATQVLATPGALAQVLATLIENSLRHGAGTTTVRSRSGGPSGAVVIEVADEGAGVPDDLAPRIFEREVTSGKGTGLGLALARDLASADGGRLELAQRRPAVFALFLSGVPASMRPDVVLPLGAVVSARRRR
ncbi:ATP-binding protein [Cellulomonas fengjieae]|uniref:Signal transduction histidine-protein kinase/phosphatase MprB n=1 Tax=Cellulomonas fengjieae TaxID=2819978 RepID=A0ABS3SDI7_9CELL|nr:ATP-binding protein [Cellulomonas fengjieae]MBO3083821.1 sensor histidine kinase [Cellulomonas fengjieae]MBO3101430.1 sensor histidine kinase [Cellulomonas fengjieae]QVI64891.1 sensor histidine kinase [Cellulomonas fengjieae]